MCAAPLDFVLEQALLLPDDQRGELAAQLIRSLEPDDADEVSGPEWEAAWSDEIDRRVGEIRAGTAELVDGDEVLAQARARIAARRA